MITELKTKAAKVTRLLVMTIAAVCVAAMLFVGYQVVSNQQAADDVEASSSDILTVDLANSLGNVGYRAIGILAPSDQVYQDNSLISQLKVKFYRNVANASQSPPAYYPIVHDQLGGRFQLVIDNDIDSGRVDPTAKTTYFACDDKVTTATGYSCPKWEAQIDSSLQFADQNHMPDVEWDVYNEPDNFFVTVYGKPRKTFAQYFDAYALAYRRIKAAKPTAKVVGPSLAVYSTIFMSQFLAKAKLNNVVPDIISLHELSEANPAYDAVTTGDVKDIRRLLTLNKLNPDSDIELQEYSGGNSSQKIGIFPQFFAATEKNHIVAGSKSCWPNISGSFDAASNECGGMLLNGLLTSTYGKTSKWWLYEKYAEMTGRMVNTSGAGQIDGIASYDATARSMRVILGRNGTASGTATIRINNFQLLSSGSRTVVKGIQATGYLLPYNSGKYNTELAALSPVNLQPYMTLINGSILQIVLPSLKAYDAYDIEIQAPYIPCGAGCMHAF